MATMKAAAKLLKIVRGGLDGLDGRPIHIHAAPYEPFTLELYAFDGEEYTILLGYQREQNGDLVPDPLIYFKVGYGTWDAGEWKPVMFENWQGCRQLVGIDGRPLVSESELADMDEYCTDFDELIASRYLPIVEEVEVLKEEFGETYRSLYAKGGDPLLRFLGDELQLLADVCRGVDDEEDEQEGERLAS